MGNRRLGGVLALPTLLAAALCAHAAPPTARRVRASGAPTIVRQITYSQLTSQENLNVRIGGNRAPVISGAGNRVAYALSSNPNRVFVVDFDGSNNREIDTYAPLVFTDPILSISEDGGTVAISDEVQIRVASADGAVKRTLITLQSNEINQIRLAGNTGKVYFTVYRDTQTTGMAPIQRGIWRINIDGTGLQQVVTPAMVAGTVGLPANNLAFFGDANNCMDVSDDGGRIVFTTRVNAAGDRFSLFTCGGDGSGLIRQNSSEIFIESIAISGNGARIAYKVNYVEFQRLFTCDAAFSSVIQLAGSGEGLVGVGNGVLPSADRQTLSFDGSRLLAGSSGLVFAADGSSAFPLGQRGTDIPGKFRITTEYFESGTMSSDGKRFAYIPPFNFFVADPANFNRFSQVAVAELDAASLGPCPSVTQPQITPPFILRDGSTRATVSAAIAGGLGTIQGNYVQVLSGNKTQEQDIFADPLEDGGINGDLVAGDGIFTHNEVATNRNFTTVALGPRPVRIQCDSRTASGLRRATVLDVAPLEVVTTHPKPVVSALFPRRARRGGEVSPVFLQGTNLFAPSTIKVLLAGTSDPNCVVTNVSVLDGSTLTFTLTLGAGAALGDRVVQVSNLGGDSTTVASALNTFTVTDLPAPPDTDHPAIVDNSVTPTDLTSAGGTVNFTVDVRDNVGAAAAEVRITDPDNTQRTVTLTPVTASIRAQGTLTRFSGSAAFPANTGATRKRHRIAFVAKDAAGNTAGPVNAPSVFVDPSPTPDTDEPSITANTVVPTDLPAGGGNAAFTLDVRDNVGAASAEVRITDPDNNVRTVALSVSASGVRPFGTLTRFSGSASFPANSTIAAKRHRVAFFAKDAAGNTAGPVNGTAVTVAASASPDTDPPAVSENNVDPTDLSFEGGDVTFTADVRDNVEVASAQVRVTDPSGGSQTINLTRLSASITAQGVLARFTGTTTIPANSAETAKRYRVHFTATDTAGNATAPVRGEAIVVGPNNLPPTVRTVTIAPNQLPSAGGRVDFTANVRAGTPTPTVTITIVQPGTRPKTIATVTMRSKGSGNFAGSATLKKNNGRTAVTYNVLITAKDRFGTDGPREVGTITIMPR